MKRNKYWWKYATLFVSFIISVFFYQNLVYAAEKNEKRVLILSSNSSTSTINSGVESKAWSDEIVFSLNAQLVSSKKNIIANVENMGFSEKYWPQYYELYKSNFTDAKFDLVICIGDTTFRFMLKYGDMIFPNTPVVFSDVRNLSDSFKIEHPLYTGLTKSNDIKSTLDIALKLHPGTKVIYALEEVEETRKQLNKLYKDKVNLVFADESDMVKLKEKINALPKDTIIYLGKQGITNNDGYMPLPERSNYLFSDINIPVYSTSMRNLQLCIEDVGGVVTDGKDLGKETGKMALRILNGEDPSNVSVMEESSHKFAFNYTQLKRFNIDLRSLPAGSEIVNLPMKSTYTIPESIVIYFGVAALIVIIGATIFITGNIYKRRRAEKLLKELMYYDNLRGNFFSNISHELKTPLNLIYSALQVLELRVCTNNEKDNEKDNGKDNNEKKYIEIMKQNCYRLLRIISNLIDISKIDAGYFYSSPQNRDIVNAVENIVLSTVQYVESKGISIIFDTEVEEKIMAFDLDAMERIILNLLSNSIKFTPRGGSIEISMWEKNESIIICVKDTGVGIPLEKQASIFEKFVQVDKSLSRSKEGSGIGLSLVKELVAMHDGSICVESTLGKGSKFIIELPVKLVPIDEDLDKKDVYANEGKVERINIEFSDIYN